MTPKRVISVDPQVGTCELCGGVGELRPYGPNNENICFNCGMKDLEVTASKFMQLRQLDQIATPQNPTKGN